MHMRPIDEEERDMETPGSAGNVPWGSAGSPMPSGQGVLHVLRRQTVSYGEARYPKAGLYGEHLFKRLLLQCGVKRRAAQGSTLCLQLWDWGLYTPL